jgi:ABC-type branched-subunit amino acid transport system ATPase component
VTPGPPMLETRGLSKSFGGIAAVADLSLRIARGARHAVIGPNGAGKTTLVNLLTGVLPPSAGTILLDGEPITALPPQARVRRGIARTFQVNQLFADFSPLQTVGLAIAERDGTARRWWRPFGARGEVIDEAMDLLAQMRLAELRDERTAVLPYGKQRLLEIAVALACRPRLLLLDEPAAGVPESERHQVLDAVARLPDDVTVLLIEHDMDLVFSLAERITVLVQGSLYAEGAPGVIAADPRVRTVYLGEEAGG